jgi:nitroreductase
LKKLNILRLLLVISKGKTCPLREIAQVIEMELMDVIKLRRSIRKYKPDLVSDQNIEAILNAARLAPSWKNYQCWKYVVVKDKETRYKIAESRVKSKDWLVKAPVIIVACANPKESGYLDGKQYFMTDIGISFEHLMLAARNRGLGTCWIGEFDENKVKEAIDAPEGIRVVAYTPLGYPEFEKREGTRRKSLEEICFFEKYGQSSSQK